MADIKGYSDQTETNVSDHYGLVKRIAYHLRTRLPSTISTEDLIQAGMEGLIHADRAYDKSRGIEFEQFAKTRIRGAMLDEVRRISYSTRSAITIKREQDNATSTLTKKLGRSPKNTEIANFLDKDLATYEKERIVAEGVDIVSTEAATVQYDEFTEPDSGPDEALEKRELITTLAESIEKLPERAQTDLDLYYQEELNLKEIGAVLDVSESRVSQIPVSYTHLTLPTKRIV
mgnify:CR=1 FL=1